MGNILTESSEPIVFDNNSRNLNDSLEESELNKLLNIGANRKVSPDIETANEKAKNIYVAIGRRYVKTVDVSFNGKNFWRNLKNPIIDKSLSRDDISNLVELMDGDEMIVTTLAEALQFICILMTSHNTTPDFIEDGVHYFASPVIFEIDENTAQNYDLNKKIEYSDINHYMITSNIPFYTSYNKTNTLDVYENVFDRLILSICDIYKCMITKSYVDKKNIKKAYYIDSYGILKCLDL